LGIKLLGENLRGRVLSVILALAILSAVGMLVYTIANPRVGERFTEFYILDLEGVAIDYPEELLVGEEGKVMAGIVNREQEVATYGVEVMIDGVKHNEIGVVTLEDGEKWEGIISFSPDKAGDNQKVEFLLYRQGWDGVYQDLHLWVNVR